MPSIGDVADSQPEILAISTERSGARRYPGNRPWSTMASRLEKKRARPLVVPSGTASLKRTIQRDYTLFGPTVDPVLQPLGLSDGAGNSVTVTGQVVCRASSTWVRIMRRSPAAFHHVSITELVR